MSASSNTGAYCILLHLSTGKRAGIGALGQLTFPPGWYVYVGSARRNLRARVDRHLMATGRRHWHIDYVAPLADRRSALLLPGGEEQELGRKLLSDNLFRVISGFGASDSPLPGHLFYVEGRKSRQRIVQHLKKLAGKTMEEYQ